MADRNVIQRESDAFAKSIGMLKHSGTWYRTTGDLVQALNLQKSQYGPVYYINIGFWLQALGESNFPGQRTWHLGIRLELLFPNRDKEIKSLLDLQSDIPEQERAQRLRHLLNSGLSPILEEANSMQGLRQLRREGRLKAAAIRGTAIPLLDAL